MCTSKVLHWPKLFDGRVLDSYGNGYGNGYG